MARKLPWEYPGAIYHPIICGDRSEPIFSDNTDRQGFLETLGQACGKTDWQMHNGLQAAGQRSSGRHR